MELLKIQRRKEEENDEDPSVAELGSVAAASGLVTALVLGPVVGVGVALAAACAGVTKTPVGSVTRKAGTSLVQTGHKIRAYDEEHHQLLNKARVGIVRGCEFTANKLKDCGGGKEVASSVIV